jgi:hypothetical protein
MAVRQLLENLAKLVGAVDPTALAAQLHILVEGMEMAGERTRRTSVRWPTPHWPPTRCSNSALLADPDLGLLFSGLQVRRKLRLRTRRCPSGS